MEAFRLVEVDYPLFLSGASVRGRAIEVFPHATAVALAAEHRPASQSKHAWRRQVLAAHGLAVDTLKSNDDVDAALAAVTGLLAVSSPFMEFGSSLEGVIVVPGTGLPQPPARSAPGTSGPRRNTRREVRRPILVLSPPEVHFAGADVVPW
jgi:predicted RNase H-like nuclease